MFICLFQNWIVEKIFATPQIHENFSLLCPCVSKHMLQHLLPRKKVFQSERGRMNALNAILSILLYIPRILWQNFARLMIVWTMKKPNLWIKIEIFIASLYEQVQLSLSRTWHKSAYEFQFRKVFECSNESCFDVFQKDNFDMSSVKNEINARYFWEEWIIFERHLANYLRLWWFLGLASIVGQRLFGILRWIVKSLCSHCIFYDVCWVQAFSDGEY